MPGIPNTCLLAIMGQVHQVDRGCQGCHMGIPVLTCRDSPGSPTWVIQVPVQSHVVAAANADVHLSWQFSQVASGTSVPCNIVPALQGISFT